MEQQLTDFLQDLKAYGIQNDIPNVTEDGGRFLNILVKVSGAQNILEIGCANGYSTIWLAEAIKMTGGKIHSIDHSKPTFEAAKENISKAGLSNAVDFYFGNALQIIPNLNQTFDFVFVDGEKRSYWDFWEIIQDRLNSKAVVVFDDVLSFPQKTELFMKKIKNVLGFDQMILPIDPDDGVLLLIKTN